MRWHNNDSEYPPQEGSYLCFGPLKRPVYTKWRKDRFGVNRFIPFFGNKDDSFGISCFFVAFFQSVETPSGYQKEWLVPDYIHRVDFWTKLPKEPEAI